MRRQSPPTDESGSPTIPELAYTAVNAGDFGSETVSGGSVAGRADTPLASRAHGDYLV
jgi:hypothetical protein